MIMGSGTGVFRVELQPSGHSFEIEAGAHSIHCAQTGHAIRYSCRQGMCGMCTGEVLAGCVDHGTNPPPATADPRKRARPVLSLPGDCKIRFRHRHRRTRNGGRPAQHAVPVAKLEKLTSDIALLRVRVPPNDRLEFLPGQYVEFSLSGIKRNYSVANALDDGGYPPAGRSAPASPRLRLAESH